MHENQSNSQAAFNATVSLGIDRHPGDAEYRLCTKGDLRKATATTAQTRNHTTEAEPHGGVGKRPLAMVRYRIRVDLRGLGTAPQRRRMGARTLEENPQGLGMVPRPLGEVSSAG